MALGSVPQWSKAVVKGSGRRQWSKAVVEGSGQRQWSKAVVDKVDRVEKKEKTTIILVSHGPMIHGSWFTPIPALPKLMLRMVEFQSASTLENFTASSGS